MYHVPLWIFTKTQSFSRDKTVCSLGRSRGRRSSYVALGHTWARGGGWWGDSSMQVVKPYVVTYAVFKLYHPPSR